MSSDGKEPGAIWQNPGPGPGPNSSSLNPQWQVADHAIDDAQAFDQDDEYSQLPDDEALAEALPLSTPAPSNIASSSPIRRALLPTGNPLSLVKQLGHYSTFFLIPLLFFLLFSLIVLPLVAAKQTNLVWPFLIIFLILATAQGVSSYYLGSSNGLWAVASVLSFCAFLVVSCFALAGLIPSLLMLLATIALCLLLARYYVHPIPEGYVDIAYSFGKYRRTLYPGLNILLPTEKARLRLNVGETQWICPSQRVQLSHTEDVVLRASISYQLVPEDAYAAVTQVNQWEESLRELLLASLQTIATTFMPEDFVAWPQGLLGQVQQGSANDGAHWDRVNAYLFQHLRDRVALWGVQVNWLRIRDVSLVPHGSIIMETGPITNTATPADRPPQNPTKSPAKASNGSTPSAKPEDPTQPDMPSPVKIPKPEALIKAYREVQHGNITDPETIRSIAQKFAYIASDPDKSKDVDFDADRAASNLFEQARKYDEQFSSGPLYDDPTNPEWLPHKRNLE
jgi:hypothetical protein